MKVIIAIAVVSCLLVLASAQDCSIQHLDQDCAAGIANPSSITPELCNRCANQVIRFINDCLHGNGVDEVKQCKLKSSRLTMLKQHACDSVTDFNMDLSILPQIALMQLEAVLQFIPSLPSSLLWL